MSTKIISRQETYFTIVFTHQEVDMTEQQYNIGSGNILIQRFKNAIKLAEREIERAETKPEIAKQLGRIEAYNEVLADIRSNLIEI